jgi:hypothetical protein
VILAEFQQVPIAGDDEIGMAFDGAFQNAIVVGSSSTTRNEC